jgi:uncharacterized RDD family membrane protein YckC
MPSDAGMSARINPYAPPSSDDVASAVDPDNDLRTANPGSRFFAAFIDGLLTMAVAIPGIIFLASIDDIAVLRDIAAAGDRALLPILAIFGPILLLNCYQWYLMTTTGQSLGKRWNHIKIVKVDGGEAGFLHAVFLRSWLCYFLLPAIPTFGDIWNIVTFIGLFFVFAGLGRTVHDYVAGTRVVEVRY